MKEHEDAITWTCCWAYRVARVVEWRCGSARDVRAESEPASGTRSVAEWGADDADAQARDRAGAAKQQRHSSGENSGERCGSRGADHQGAVHAEFVRGFRRGLALWHPGNSGRARTIHLQRD